jgi:PAS domain S-box-containing protein
LHPQIPGAPPAVLVPVVDATHRSDAELDRFFALSLELLCVAGLDDGYFKRVNPSWERVLGWTTEELLSRPFIDFVHPDDRDASVAEVARLARGTVTLSFDNRVRCRDGSYVWLAWTATPCLETGLLYAAGHDVTERKLHQARLERMVDINRALLDASVDGIRMVDLEGRTLLANSVIEHLRREVFRVPEYTTTLDGAAIAGRLTDPASYLATLQAIKDDPECATHDQFELADVRRAFARHTGPVRDSAGELIGRIIVMREITAEREAAQLKSELVATVSHELRTPLAGVLGFAELLLRNRLDDATRRRYAETIRGEAQRLTALVDDFLDLQRIEAGRFALALESFDLCALVAHQVDLFSAQSARHTLAFAAPDEPFELVGDRSRIGQVIANLLSNAIKYSPAGGTVTITATCLDGLIRVSIADGGLGIPAAQQAQVFTRFFRVDSSDTRKIGGTGLGLALCQDIVAAHSGRTGFESTEGEGSTFWFELPSAASVQPAHQQAA